MRTHLAKILYFEAAHRNPQGAAPQQRLHGHSYKVELLADGDVDPILGWIVDYGDLKALFQPIHDQLDHAYLNEVPGLEEDATLDGVKRWIERRLAERGSPAPPWFGGIRLSILGDLAFRPVRLPARETEGLPERIRFRFEAAQSLPQLPEGHPCRRIHGHSYQVEVGASGLDGLEAQLEALYGELDHQYLNDIEGLEHATCERICRWMWEWLEARALRPAAIVVQETSSARCIYYGE